jgi:predicted outer membrane protein
MTEWIRLVLELLFFPIAIGLIIWAVTQRKTDKAAIQKTLAEASKLDVEGEVAKETVEAAVQLADIKTLQELVTSMAGAYKEERETLERRLASAIQTAETALSRQTELSHEVDDLRADVQRYHREVLDMYRRDQYQAHALELLTDWIETHLPKLLDRYPEIPKPPILEALPPLHIHVDEDVPARRWYDREPAVDAHDQEL